MPNETLRTALDSSVFNYLKEIGGGSVLKGIEKLSASSSASKPEKISPQLGYLFSPLQAQELRNRQCSIFEITYVLPGLKQFLQFMFEANSLLDPCFVKMKLKISGTLEIYKAEEPIEGNFFGEPFIAQYFVKTNWTGEKTAIYKKRVGGGVPRYRERTEQL